MVGIDRDLHTVQKLHAQLGSTAKIIHGNYKDIIPILQGLGYDTVDGGIIADLGVSSMQLDDAARGFSFLKDGPLDMRMDPTAPVTAEELVNHLSEKELADIIYQYGEERQSRLIAKYIVKERPLHTTSELSDLVCRCLSRRGGKSASRREIHPATRTFQALRIAVNEELQHLESFLHDSIKILDPGARLVVISFHSLEDRLVKQTFRKAATACICPPRQPICNCNHQRQLQIITPKPICPEDSEALANPRSRSAKLRAGEKVS